MNADMGIFSVLLLAIALGLDAFSMSIGVGIQGVSTTQTGQLSLMIGSLHIILPLLGIFLGHAMGNIAGSIATYLGAGVLIILGVKMIYEEIYGKEEEFRLGSGWQFVILPISVSLDSLSIGFSLGTFGVQKLFYVTGVFGVVAALMTVLGVLLGIRIGHRVDKTGVLGGTILILLGAKMLFF